MKGHHRGYAWRVKGAVPGRPYTFIYIYIYIYIQPPTGRYISYISMPRYTLLVALLLGVVLLGLPETSGGRRGGRDRRGRARRQKVAEDTEGVASPPPFPSPTPPPAPSPLQAPGGDNTTTVTPLGGQLENATTAAAMLTLSSTTSASVSASASAVAPTEGRSRTAGRQDKHRLLAAEKSHPALSSSSTSQDHVRSGR